MPDKQNATFKLTLQADRAIVITRVFDAPRKLVFEAFTKPEHVAHWWGPRSTTMSVCEMDFRPGGAWRFVTRDGDGEEYGFKGVYREIAPPERLVQTFEFEGMPGHVAVETLRFEEHDGKTKLTNTIFYASAEDRDGHFNSGMEPGARESLDRLAEYVATSLAAGNPAKRK